ncbi:Acetyl-coenzyme A transporter 1 [Trichinella britovi]|uniref:Acetyl-coenzyme A transporter 1 n=3 Tax=Trichinella TaxID=6333 RepID=A0A0V1CUR0_TRIBR|nr:Acetyl-coenzyme A transporter 1 [Trichinella murrelli]KRX64476.1 Acetyl-coenzyme A transporter 1 [Trichinella sp. T9]KRX76474.1 Acetyl-coenzyme A transporter 1 [Trichinella sp. T6]KRY12236.1 Acetyl-coenzyme A transporter 1 [Trichinella patagoniensis]KRY52882.1 Acetyl-coenzyme A transporter 1 [Trichinella britovi]
MKNKQPRRRVRSKEDGSFAIALGQPDLESEMIGPHVPLFPTSVFKGDGVASGKSGHFVTGELANIVLLVFLYTLQGIPLGLTASIPLVLQNRHVSYKQQALFSFAQWPFSLKLLWAPIVDACYSPRFGRRKSWLVPTQYLIGLFMVVLSYSVDSLLGSDENPVDKPNLFMLTAIFFTFNFLAATQDIAVDGWALTMLSSENVGYASTCNAVGQTAGYFLGNVVFLALESKDFCNRFLRTVPAGRGLVTLSEYVFFWAIIFIISTTVVMILKRERESGKDTDEMGVMEAYRLLGKIIRLHPVVMLTCLHLTAKIAFAAADGITGLKLIEHGVRKDMLALLAVPIIPLELLLPVVIGKYTTGRRPLTAYLTAYPYRNMLSLVFALMVWWTPYWKQPDGQYPVAYYALILLIFALQQVALHCMFVSQMAFHAKVSDPTVGGTYMTLLNTVANLGGNWPLTVALSLTELVTMRRCEKGVAGGDSSSSPSSLNATFNAVDNRHWPAPNCDVLVDGYTVLIGCGFVVGCFWKLFCGKLFEQLQHLDKRSWTCGSAERC